MYHRVRLPLTVVLLGAMLAGASAFAQAPAAPVLSNPIVNGRGVVLQWTDPSPNTATGVRIEAGSASGLSDLAVMDFPYWVTGHAIEPVPPGRYYVRVRARSAGGWGPSSNEQIVPVAGCPEPPAVPHFGANVAGQRVQLVISPDQTGCAPTSHIIEVGRSRGQTDILQAPLAGLVATFDSVPAGTYFVRLRAVHEGGISAPSADLEVSVAGGCRPPFEITNLSAPTLGNAVTVRFQYAFDDSHAFPTRVVLEAGTSAGASDIGTIALGVEGSRGHTIWGPPGEYWARVRAFNGCGSSVSDDVRVTLTSECVAPGPPIGPDAGFLQALGITWAAPASGGIASEYRVEVGTEPGQSNVATRRVPAADGNQGGQVFIDGLPPRTYFARVFATNVCGTSPASVVARATAPQCPNPPAPGIHPVEVSGSQVTLRWAGSTLGGPVYESGIAIGSAEGGSDIVLSPPNGGDHQTPSYSISLPPGRYFARAYRSHGTSCGVVWSNSSREVSFEVGVP